MATRRYLVGKYEEYYNSLQGEGAVAGKSNEFISDISTIVNEYGNISQIMTYWSGEAKDAMSNETIATILEEFKTTQQNLQESLGPCCEAIDSVAANLSTLKQLEDEMLQEENELESLKRGEPARTIVENNETITNPSHDEWARKVAEKEEKIKNYITKLDELKEKIDNDIKTIEDLESQLGEFSNYMNLTGTILGIGESNEFSKYTLEERLKYLQDIIDNYDVIYNSLNDLYKERYGKGFSFSQEDFKNLDIIFDAFDIYWLSGVDRKDVCKSKDGESVLLDISKLTKVIGFCNSSGMFDKIEKYLDGASWKDSGLEDFYFEKSPNFLKINVFNENALKNRLKNNYGIPENGVRDFLKDKMNSFKESYQKLMGDYSEYQKLTGTMAVIKEKISNLKNAQKLMPYEMAMENPDFQDYLNKDYSNYSLLDKDKVSIMSQKELALYDYLLHNESKETANGYIKALDNAFNQRIGAKKAAEYIEWIKADGFDAGDLFNAGWEGAKDGVRTFFDGFADLFKVSSTEEGDKSALDYELMYKAQWTQQLMSDPSFIDQNTNKNWLGITDLSQWYNTASSIGNMAIPALIGMVPGCQGLSSVLFGASIMGNTAVEAKQEGYTTAQAYLYGGVTGLSEAVTEKLLGGIDGLSTKALGQTVLQNMFSEGLEEFVQEYMDVGARALILGESVDLSASGMLEQLNKATDAFKQGAITAGVMDVGTRRIVNPVMNVATRTLGPKVTTYNASTGAMETKSKYNSFAEFSMAKESAKSVATATEVINESLEKINNGQELNLIDKVKLNNAISDVSVEELSAINKNLAPNSMQTIEKASKGVPSLSKKTSSKIELTSKYDEVMQSKTTLKDVNFTKNDFKDEVTRDGRKLGNIIAEQKANEIDAETRAHITQASKSEMRSIDHQINKQNKIFAKMEAKQQRIENTTQRSSVEVINDIDNSSTTNDTDVITQISEHIDQSSIDTPAQPISLDSYHESVVRAASEIEAPVQEVNNTPVINAATSSMEMHDQSVNNTPVINVAKQGIETPVQPASIEQASNITTFDGPAITPSVDIVQNTQKTNNTFNTDVKKASTIGLGLSAASLGINQALSQQQVTQNILTETAGATANHKDYSFQTRTKPSSEVRSSETTTETTTRQPERIINTSTQTSHSERIEAAAGPSIDLSSPFRTRLKDFIKERAIRKREKAITRGNLEAIDTYLETATEEEIREQLDSFNTEVVKTGEGKYYIFNDPIIAERLNTKYRELTGENHPTYIAEEAKVIERLLNNEEKLIKEGTYTKEEIEQLKFIKDTIEVTEKYGGIKEGIPTLENYPPKDIGRVLNNLDAATATEIGEILDFYHMGTVESEGVVYSSFDDPIAAQKLNTKYRELTGKNHPTYEKYVVKVVDELTSQRNELINAGVYTKEDFKKIEAAKEEMIPKRKGIVGATREKIAEIIRTASEERAIRKAEKTITRGNIEAIDTYLETATEEEIREQLDSFNTEVVKTGEGKYYIFNDPIIAERLNTKYRELTGENHSVYENEISGVINKILKHRNELIKIGLFTKEDINKISLMKDEIKLSRKYDNLGAPLTIENYPPKDIGRVLNNLDAATETEIEEILDFYNLGSRVISDGVVYSPFDDPIVAQELNTIYRKLTGENHPTYENEVPKVIDNLIKDKKILIKTGVYTEEYFNKLETLKKQLSVKNVSQSTNLYEIAEVIQQLNPNAKIEVGNIEKDSRAETRFYSSVPVEKLVLPEGFYYNDKNGITNKHNTKSGVYCALEVEDIRTADKSTLLSNKKGPIREKVDNSVMGSIESVRNRISAEIKPIKNLESVTNYLETATVKEISNQLNNYNRRPVKGSDGKYYAFNDPVVAEMLNTKYKELTGENHPTYEKEIIKVIDKLMNNKGEVIKSGMYTQKDFKKFEAIRKEIISARTSILQTVRNKISNLVKNSVTAKKDSKTNIPLMENVESAFKFLETATKEEISERLNNFNGKSIRGSDGKYYSFDNPIIAEMLNERYFELTGENHPVYNKQILSVVNKLLKNKKSLIKSGTYSENDFSVIKTIEYYAKVTEKYGDPIVIDKYTGNKLYKVLDNIYNETAQSISEQLNYFGKFVKARDDMTVYYPPFDNPIVAEQLNARYKELTGENHPVYVKELPKVIDILMSNNKEFLKNMPYTPEKINRLKRLKSIVLNDEKLRTYLKYATEEEISNRLDRINKRSIRPEDRKYSPNNNPLVAEMLNSRYRELTGKDHPEYVKNISKMIDKLNKHCQSLINAGIYTEEDFHKFDLMKNEISKIMRKGKTYSDENKPILYGSGKNVSEPKGISGYISGYKKETIFNESDNTVENTVYGNLASKLQKELEIDIQKLYTKGDHVVAYDLYGNCFTFNFNSKGDFDSQVRKIVEQYEMRYIPSRTSSFDFFEKHGSVRQNALRKLHKEEKNAIALFGEKTYGMSRVDSEVLFKSIDRTGACSYANACNIIYSLYESADAFEKDFGYPMFKSDGSLNDAQLLYDIYVWVNSHYNASQMLVVSPNGKVSVNRQYLVKTEVVDDSIQTYFSNDVDGFKGGMLANFLKSKNSSVFTSIYHSTACKCTVDYSVVDAIESAISKGDCISELAILDDVVMKKVKDGTIETIPKTKGHSVTLVGVNLKGFFVRSWGELWYIPRNQLHYRGKFEGKPYGVISYNKKK